MITLLILMCTQVHRFLQLYLKEAYDFFDGFCSSTSKRLTTSSTEWMYRNLTSSTYDDQSSVRGLDILTIHLFVLHNTDTISFPVFSSRFLRYNKQKPVPPKKC
jgi:hypothetical protein